MDHQNMLYPATPVDVPLAFTEPSDSFKKEVRRVLGSVVMFFIVYLVMFLLSIGLVVACFYGGIAIITGMASLYGIIAGLGLMGVGLMVFIFLVKFMFAVSRYDRSGIIEIKEAQHPRLFAFIRQLALDTQTPFPKKIYLSPDVNACVFYDSGFWSMFLPVRKNLQIGLGLVNSLNLSEFKAVMAHEFGHFSQRSMKLGSFVYNVNKIIYNLLFENNSYSKFLNSWAQAGNIFAFFASITARIANGIQAVLRRMYAFINKNYMRLSREMEFHADAVAASVSGSQNLVSALRRVELSGSGYNIALQKCDDLFRQKKISNNIYPNQTSVVLKIAAEHKLPLVDNLPVVSNEFLRSGNLSRINYKDQWASHPTMEDREQQLEQLSVRAERVETSAWHLFDHAEQLQQLLTEKIYSGLDLPPDVIRVEAREFQDKLEQDIKYFSYPDIYKGFYDNRRITVQTPDDWNSENEIDSLEEIFSPYNISLPKKIQSITADLEIVKGIAEKRIQVKTFDFDGKKYAAADAELVIKELGEELSALQQSMDEADKKATRFFLLKAKQHQQHEQLRKKYIDYFKWHSEADALLIGINDIMELMYPIFTGQTIPIERINVIIDDLKTDHEPKLKERLTGWLALNAFDDDADTKLLVGDFVNTRHTYFSDSGFLERQLVMLNDVIHRGWSSVNQYIFMQFKLILESQLSYLDDTVRAETPVIQ